MALLKKNIRPEFLNRIDEIIMFTPLSKEEIRDIVLIQLGNLSKQLADNGFEIEFTPRAVDMLSAMGYDPQFGARPLKRVIQKYIMNALSKKIIAGTLNPENLIKIDYDNDDFVFAA